MAAQSLTIAYPTRGLICFEVGELIPFMVSNSRIVLEKGIGRKYKEHGNTVCASPSPDALNLLQRSTEVVGMVLWFRPVPCLAWENFILCFNLIPSLSVFTPIHLAEALKQRLSLSGECESLLKQSRRDHSPMQNWSYCLLCVYQATLAVHTRSFSAISAKFSAHWKGCLLSVAHSMYFLSCALLLCQMVYVMLMYFEFGIGEWLDERPLLYGLSHQVQYAMCASQLFGSAVTTSALPNECGA